ncbi:DUF1348 family protein [Mycolicibacterium cosmeticum]|nr:DUF1348 family protein [Mycolicibacterium cosmeticum]
MFGSADQSHLDWNTRDQYRVSLAYNPDSVWRSTRTD